MQRDIYDEDHDAFREVVKEFVKRYLTREKAEQWDRDGEVDRNTMRAAAEHGLVGLSVPEDFGGGGMLMDYRFRSVVNEEIIRSGIGSPLAGAFGIQDDLAVPYLAHFGTDAQKQQWLPRMATAEVLGALAMTEPGAGSDLRAVKTTAKKVDGGYVVNGAKTFISSGKTADVVVTFVKTGEGNRPDAFSLILVEDGMAGFEHSKTLHKMGFPGHDTAELSFTDVFVPDENLIGGVEGRGFLQLMMNLPLERLSIGAVAAAVAEAALGWTLDYTTSREAFGQPIVDFQNTRFRLAEMATTVDAMWAFLDRAMTLYRQGELTADEAAKVKFWCTEREWEVLDQGVQLHGGYGYILEYPIARAFVDARVHRIYGGTNEVMREIVARSVTGRR
ncbi:acyl-CoA dehydrogenase domain protein [Xylanimonas cellulosilytica DSM 15894]|uniref:Acyl-CoA dehydrogenase domain protein n=1 Tax=Xylanimonas cellulosilytica (strain DSM 15894 / JCM 12276 / CECT 5975 / KCTC 9989 / LMG 20990 / NBRC 107835 / XIL07) TaxID=446471 RepID=D1BYZ8_XYLCX|nr:acyl-CoA dehydrogenase family protein [Xylanimonas cellulosilytica]ACZ30073.1 acyl-CoA dehydrogenase domain protein [Xylanimonas cellulosilytica DSM 15894]